MRFIVQPVYNPTQPYSSSFKTALDIMRTMDVDQGGAVLLTIIGSAHADAYNTRDTDAMWGDL